MKNNSKKLKPFVLLIAFVLSACAGVDPKQMEPVVGVEPIQLTQPYEYAVNIPGGGRHKITITTGTFVPVAKDSAGIYYKGPPLCFTTVVLVAGWAQSANDVNKIWRMADCGVFIPTLPQLPAKIFTVIGTDLSPAQMEQVQANASSLATTYAATGVFKPPMATSVQAGLGAGIGFAVAGAFAEAENGRFVFLLRQDETMRLRETVTKSAISPTPSATPAQ